MQELDIISKSLLYRELEDQLKLHGINSFLPQNLRDSHLYSLIHYTEQLFNQDNDNSGSLGPIMMVVSYICLHQNGNKKISLSDDELFEKIEAYFYTLLFEDIATCSFSSSEEMVS